MGTRGAYGFRINGRDLIAYNHFDSYLEGLGAEILAQTKRIVDGADMVALKEKVFKLRQIKGGKKPTAADVKALKPWTDLSVSEQSTKDWYCLTRKMQGDLEASLKSGYFPKDSAAFLLDSLFCEYAYILNLDDDTLEVYKGFNAEKGKEKDGRYACLKTKDAEHFGVRLLKAYPLADLPKNFEELEEKEEATA